MEDLMQKFEEIVSDSDAKTIRVGSLSELEGKGTEYLVGVNGDILLKFFNGNLVKDAPQGNTEKTI